MAKAIIKLAYRQVINASSAGVTEQRIWNDSYNEFLLKIQSYNQENKLTRFSDIVARDGRANSLHYKISFAVLQHLGSFKNKIPGLYDAAGRNSLSFEIPEFKLLESDTEDKSQHAVAVIYLTGELTLLESFGEYLVLTNADVTMKKEEEIETFVLQMRPGLSVCSWKSAVAGTKPVMTLQLSE
jgi:hypothetical protein